MGKSFEELKRRNIFREGIAYLAAAWLVIQVVETIFPAFGFGNPAVRIEVIALAIVSLLRDEPEATLERADATSSI